MFGGGEGEFPRISEVIVFATTLECDGDSVRRMSCVDDSGEMVGTNHAVFNPLISFRALYVEERQILTLFITTALSDKNLK